MSLCAYGKWKQETWISFGEREKLCDGRRSSQWKRIFASPFLLTSIFSFYFRSVTLTEPFLSSFFSLFLRVCHAKTFLPSSNSIYLFSCARNFVCIVEVHHFSFAIILQWCAATVAASFLLLMLLESSCCLFISRFILSFDSIFSRFSAFYSICYAQCALIPSDYIKINGSIKSCVCVVYVCVCLSWQRVTAFFSRYTQQSDGKASTKQPGSGGSCRSNHSHWDW